jgi:cell division protein FtsX
MAMAAMARHMVLASALVLGSAACTGGSSAAAPSSVAPSTEDQLSCYGLGADGAREVRYLNHDDALSEFSSIFASDPQLLANVKPSALPTSYQVALASGADPDQMRTKYRAMLGVREVIIPPR